MLQNLVIERFGLKFHAETKQAQGFELTNDQNGFRLTPSAAPLEATPSNTKVPRRAPKLNRQGDTILNEVGTWGASYDHQLGVIRTSFRQCSMKDLAGMLSVTYGEGSVPVIDKTEIKGSFDFHLVLPIPSIRIRPLGWEGRTLTTEQVPPPASPDASVADLRGLAGSLAKQTGLRLKAVKLLLPAMVIDSVGRMPTEN